MNERVLNGRYRVGRSLGQGQVANLFLCDDLLLERTVAVKILQPNDAGDSGGVERFRREAMTLARLRSPHVVGVYDIGIDKGVPFLVLQHIEGRTLEQEIARNGPMPASGIETALTQVLAGLAELHVRGLAHRDIRPSNVLLDHRGAVVLLSLAHHVTPESDAFANDIYQVGLLVLYLATGFDVIMQPLRQTLDEVIERVPPGLMSVVRRAIEREPGDRYCSAVAMKEAVTAALRITEETWVSAQREYDNDCEPTPPLRLHATARRKLASAVEQLLPAFVPIVRVIGLGRGTSEYMRTPLIQPLPPSRGKILIVEDDDLIRRQIHALLAPTYQVCIARDEADACSQIGTGARFSVVLCGLSSPMRFHDALFATVPDQAAAMLFLTSEPSAETTRFLDHVANRRLPKPFEPMILERLIWEQIATTRRAITVR